MRRLLSVTEKNGWVRFQLWTNFCMCNSSNFFNENKTGTLSRGEAVVTSSEKNHQLNKLSP